MKHQAVYDEVSTGIYEKHYTPKAGDTVVDVGAHIGYFTERALNYVGPTGFVFAFEPEPQNYADLVERLGDRQNLLAVNLAVTDNSEFGRPLFRSEKNSGGHSLFHPWAEGDMVLVETTDLDSYIERPVDFLKLDCEGAEVHVLLGAERIIRRFRPPIAMEIHSGGHWKNVRAILEPDYTFDPDPPPDNSGWIAYAIPKER